MMLLECKGSLCRTASMTEQTGFYLPFGHSLPEYEVALDRLLLLFFF